MEPINNSVQNPEPLQPNKTTSKKILAVVVSIVVVVVVAAGIVIGLKLSLKTSPQTPSNTSTKTTFPNLSKNYGACSLISENQIKSTLGKIANNIQAPVNIGIVGVTLIGTKLSNFSADAQLCSYHFAPVSKSATYTNDNGLNIQVTKFGNSASTAAYQNEFKTDTTAIVVENLGDAAFYTQSAAGETETYFALQVFKGNILYQYTLYLPANTSMDSSTAQKALTSLAQD